MNVDVHNERAWDLNSKLGVSYCTPVGNDAIELARSGVIKINLAPGFQIPSTWLDGIEGSKVLALAAGGGQQAPLLAAAGCKVTLIDISQEQLNTEKKIQKQFNLNYQLIKLSVEDLNRLSDAGKFGFIINPLSNCFFPNLKKVWRNCSDLLRPGGRLIYSFINPICFQFDYEKANSGEFVLKYSQPYSDISSLSEIEKSKFIGNETPLEFGHSLSSQLGALLKNGFKILDLEESSWEDDDKLKDYIPNFIHILAEKN